MFENITKFFKKFNKKEEKTLANSKEAAKERLHLVLMQDRANVSADFLELMKQEIIDVIKKYIDVDESAIDVRLTNKENADGTNGAPALYANIPIINIKNEARKIEKSIEHKESEQKENKQKDSKQEEKENKTQKEEIKQKEQHKAKDETKNDTKNETTNSSEKEETKKESKEEKNKEENKDTKENKIKKENHNQEEKRENNKQKNPKTEKAVTKEKVKSKK